MKAVKAGGRTVLRSTSSHPSTPPIRQYPLPLWPPAPLHPSQTRSKPTIHPAFHQLRRDLVGLPKFSAISSDVHVLSSPAEFYQTLLARIATAKRRIFIASLYVGKDETELIGALHAALKAKPELRLTLVVDYLRSTRETPRPSSGSLCASLCAAFPSQVDLRLYHTPKLAGLLKRIVPRRFDEGWGLQHMKCYGFDDSVIMSGANLSSDYFTNRQDRYIEFSNHPPLADYFDSLLGRVGSLSYKVSAVDTTTLNPTIDIYWPESNIAPSPIHSPRSIPDYTQAANAAFTDLTSDWAARDGTALAPALKPQLGAPNRLDQSQLDTTISPLLQMGLFGIRQETVTVVPAIFRAANALATAPGGSRTTLHWTSGYFSVQKDYLERVLDCEAQYIPAAYTYLVRRFYDEAVSRLKPNRDAHIELREWNKPGWTYHAKGVWLAPSFPTANNQQRAFSNQPLTDRALDLSPYFRSLHPLPPHLTMIGSSNYGPRSAERDLEATVLVETSSEQLKWKFEHELREVREWARGVVDSRLFAQKKRQVHWLTKLAARRIESFL